MTTTSELIRTQLVLTTRSDAKEQNVSPNFQHFLCATYVRHRPIQITDFHTTSRSTQRQTKPSDNYRRYIQSLPDARTPLNDRSIVHIVKSKGVNIFTIVIPWLQFDTIFPTRSYSNWMLWSESRCRVSRQLVRILSPSLMSNNSENLCQQ